MDKLTEGQIEILTDYCTSQHEAHEAWPDLYDATQNHGKNILYLQSIM